MVFKMDYFFHLQINLDTFPLTEVVIVSFHILVEQRDRKVRFHHWSDNYKSILNADNLDRVN